MKSLFGATLLLLLAILPGCRSKERPPEMKEGNPAILIQATFAGITDSITASPKDPDLYLRRAELLSQSREYALAYEDLTKAWELSPAQSIAEYRVNMLFLSGKNEAAMVLLDELTKKFPENINLQRRKGEALLQNKQYEDALLVYNKIISGDTLDFEAYHERALISLEKLDTPAAMNDLETSFRLLPLQITAMTLANLYAEGKHPRALELADMVIARDSARELIDPVFIKGVYYGNIKNYPKALEQYNTCIKMDWKFQEAYIEKGIIYFEQKNLDEALQQFKLAATVTNTFPDAYFWQGRCYEQLGMDDEALANYVRAYSLDKSFTEAVEAAARVKAKKGER